MKLKTKMLKNLISVLCAATIATSGVVTSVSAGSTLTSCCKKKGQPLTKKDEFKLKYDEAKSIYDEILAGKRFLDKTEENRLNSIDMKFIELSGMYDEIVNYKDDDKISAAIDKVGKLQKDMAKLLSKVQNALAKEESSPIERRQALNDRLYNFINKVYELEQWIINNQNSDKDKDSAIVVDIAWIGVRCQELESEYNALLNEKEINHDRYKKLIDEGDRFIKRIDHFKEKHGLAKLMAAAEMLNGIENPLRRRFYEVTSKTKDKASRRIAEITAEIQKLCEENTKIYENMKNERKEREAANLMVVAAKKKKEAMESFVNKVDNIWINKIKDNNKYAMDQLKKNNLGLKTNKLAQITEKVIKKHFMNKFRDNDLGLQKKEAMESFLNKVDNIWIDKIKDNNKYVMDQLRNKSVLKYWESENSRLKEQDDELEAQRKKEKEMSDLKAKKDELNNAKNKVKNQFKAILDGPEYLSLEYSKKDNFYRTQINLMKNRIERHLEKLNKSIDMQKVSQLKEEVDKFQKYIEGPNKIEQVAENKEGSEKKKAYKITEDNEDGLIKKVNEKIEEFKAKQSQAVQRLTEMPKDTLSIEQNVFMDETDKEHTVESEQKIIHDIINRAALDIEKVKENFDLYSVEKFYKEIDNYIEKLDCSIKILNTLSNRLKLENKDGNEKKKTDRVAKKNKKVTFNLDPVYSNDVPDCNM